MNIDSNLIKDLISQTIKKTYQYFSIGNYIDAEILLEQALKIDYSLEIRQLLTVCKMNLKKYDEAKVICLETVKESNSAEDYNNLGLIEKLQGNCRKALVFYKKAMSINSNKPSILANYASFLYEKKKTKKAHELIDKAIELSPKHEVFKLNKTSMYMALCKYKMASVYLQSIMGEIDKNSYLNVEYFYCMAAQGKYSQAWNHFEARYSSVQPIKKTLERYKKPLLKEKKNFYEEKICIVQEQGAGDNMMFLRFIPEFLKIAPNSYFESGRLFGSYCDKIGINHQETISEDATHIIGLMSLPYLLDVKKASIPLNPFAYEKKSNDKIKIGLCWAGSPLHPMDYQRSTFLRSYDELLKNDKFEIYSFQKDRRPRKYINNDKIYDFSDGFDEYRLTDLSEKLVDVYSTARLMLDMDYMVSVDTFPAHIAATCGIPTMLILSDKPDWRWGFRKKKTEWYPSIEIFRCHKNTKLENIVSQIADKIEKGCQNNF